MPAKHLRSGAFKAALRREAVHVLTQGGMAAAQAQEKADQIASALQRKLGGSKVYIGKPVPSLRANAARATELKDQGLSVREVAGRMGLCVSYVYRLLGCTAQHQAQDQVHGTPKVRHKPAARKG